MDKRLEQTPERRRPALRDAPRCYEKLDERCTLSLTFQCSAACCVMSFTLALSLAFSAFLREVQAFLSLVRCTHSRRQGIATPRSLRYAFDPCSFPLFSAVPCVSVSLRENVFALSHSPSLITLFRERYCCVRYLQLPTRNAKGLVIVTVYVVSFCIGRNAPQGYSFNRTAVP
jgi:hypothetical protein